MGSLSITKEALVYPVDNQFFELSYGRRRAAAGGLKSRPDHLDYEILSRDTMLPIGAIRVDAHSDCVKVMGVMLCCDGADKWVALPATKFTSELDAVQAIRMTIGVLQGLEE